MTFIEFSTQQHGIHILFPNAHKTYSKLDYILAHKIGLNASKGIQIIQSRLSDHAMSIP